MVKWGGLVLVVESQWATKHTHTQRERERERERERVRNVPQACTVLCPGSSAGQYCSHIPEQRSSIR